MDVFTPEKRSLVMAAIRRRGNRTTERRFAAILRGSGIGGWKLHSTEVPGSPDFFFRRERLAIFIDGCFWHGCPRCFQQPRQNAEFWSRKIGANRSRDRSVSRRLRRAGVRVVRIWEHELERRTKRLERFVQALVHCQKPSKDQRSDWLKSPR